MSYLPRMSKTYKEPEERKHEDGAKEITFNSIPIASALPDDKAYNPQTILKQYNFYPHPPPQLPGPSLIEEAEQNEKTSVLAKSPRTRKESLHAPEEESVEEFPYQNESKTATINVALTVFEPPKLDNAEMPITLSNAIRIKKDLKKANTTFNTPENELGGLETTYSIDENEQKGTACQTEALSACDQSQEKTIYNVPNEIQSINFRHENEISIRNLCTGVPSNEMNSVRRSGSRSFEILTNEKRNVPKSLIHQGVQCNPHGLNEKTFTMPCSVHYLMKTLSFLVLELDRKEEHDNAGTTKEVKKLLNQIHESIVALLGRHKISEYNLQTSVSDLKRLEKIYNDLEEYMKLIYGEGGKFGCKSEEKKKVYCKLSQKDYELKFLHEKLREGGIQNSNLKFMNCMIKSPEVILQNKNLENEQLTAEIKFNNEELKRFQQALAEMNWEIHKSKEEILELRKKLAGFRSRSKKMTFSANRSY